MPTSSQTILDLFRLDNKIALITGAATGLGAAIAIALAEAGATVAVHGHHRPPPHTPAKADEPKPTKALPNKGAPKTIQLTPIPPGYSPTTTTDPLQPDETRNRKTLEPTPAGRWGQPQELAGAALYLS